MSGGAPTYGAKLMADTLLTARLVETMTSSSDIDVSVKCRIGVFDSVDDLHPLNERDYEYITNYISAIHNAGANHVILHARPAILSGLSPVKNRIVPTLDYDFVNRLASDFDGKVKITLNGGITSMSELNCLQEDESSRIQSHMAGRWCLRRPLDLLTIEQSLSNTEMMNPVKAIERYTDYALANQSQFTMSDLCLPLYLAVEQLREDYDQDEEGDLLTWEDMEDLYDSVQDGLKELGGNKIKTSSSINFKKLASSFKPLVGTKVANKWKRNRAEL